MTSYELKIPIHKSQTGYGDGEDARLVIRLGLGLFFSLAVTVTLTDTGIVTFTFAFVLSLLLISDFGPRTSALAGAEGAEAVDGGGKLESSWSVEIAGRDGHQHG